MDLTAHYINSKLSQLQDFYKTFSSFPVIVEDNTGLVLNPKISEFLNSCLKLKSSPLVFALLTTELFLVLRNFNYGFSTWFIGYQAQEYLPILQKQLYSIHVDNKLYYTKTDLDYPVISMNNTIPILSTPMESLAVLADDRFPIVIVDGNFVLNSNVKVIDLIRKVKVNGYCFIYFSDGIVSDPFLERFEVSAFFQVFIYKLHVTDEIKEELDNQPVNPYLEQKIDELIQYYFLLLNTLEQIQTIDYTRPEWDEQINTAIVLANQIEQYLLNLIKELTNQDIIYLANCIKTVFIDSLLEKQRDCSNMSFFLQKLQETAEEFIQAMQKEFSFLQAE